MAVLEIIDVPHPTLKKVAEEVRPEEFGEELQELCSNMIETMLDAPGVGLAAPQVNISKRVLVIDVRDTDPSREPFAMVNPKIVERSGSTVCEEGCLSIPEFRAEIKRSKWIKVEYQDAYGKAYTLEDEGFLAIVVQHETDHLNGITMLDHVSAMKRMMYLKKIRKLQKALVSA